MSNEIKVTLIIPPSDQQVEVELDNAFHPDEIIQNLSDENVLPEINEGYRLAIKGGNELIDAPISDQGVKEGAVIRVFPNTDAGI